jgi:hypothetical protein
MSDNVDDFLAHYGVKGMKWGVTRAAGGVKSAAGKIKAKSKAKKAQRKENADKAREAGYTKFQKGNDLQNVGTGGVRKIEKRIANGETIRAARAKEYASSTAKGLAVGAAILAAPIALVALDKGAANLAASVNAKRGAAAAAKLLSDEKGLTSYKTIALAFDKATGTFK